MRKIKAGVRILLFLIWLLVFTCFVYADDTFELHVLDVGQGQSVLVESDNHFMINPPKVGFHEPDGL